MNTRAFVLGVVPTKGSMYLDNTIGLWPIVCSLEFPKFAEKYTALENNLKELEASSKHDSTTLSRLLLAANAVNLAHRPAGPRPVHV